MQKFVINLRNLAKIEQNCNNFENIKLFLSNFEIFWSKFNFENFHLFSYSLQNFALKSFNFYHFI